MYCYIIRNIVVSTVICTIHIKKEIDEGSTLILTYQLGKK